MKVKPSHNHTTHKPNGNIFFVDPATKQFIELATVTVHQRGQLVHQFNGNFESPTVTPAVLILDGVNVSGQVDVDMTKAATINSFMITDGNVRYLEISNHLLKGKTVPMPDF